MRNPCADDDDECQGRSRNIWHCRNIHSDRNWTGFSVSLGRPEPQSTFKPKSSTSLDRTQFTSVHHPFLINMLLTSLDCRHAAQPDPWLQTLRNFGIHPDILTVPLCSSIPMALYKLCQDFTVNTHRESLFLSLFLSLFDEAAYPFSIYLSIHLFIYYFSIHPSVYLNSISNTVFFV